MADYVECALADEAQLRVWRDKHGLSPGRKSVDEIATALERSRTVVAVVTSDYLNSAWCMGEFFVAASYNNFVVVLSEGISFNAIPFDRGATTAVRFSKLNSSARDLQSFCQAVFDKGRESNIPIGLSGSPLYELGGPALVLNLLSGRTPLGVLAPTKRRSQLLEAVSTLEASPIQGLRDGLARFSKADFLMVGLRDMEVALRGSENCSEEWLALGHLARPFNKQLMNRAFDHAGISETTMRSEFGIEDEELPPRIRRRSPRPTLTDKQKRILRDIVPVGERTLAPTTVQRHEAAPSPLGYEPELEDTRAQPMGETSDLSEAPWWAAVVAVLALALIGSVFLFLNGLENTESTEQAGDEFASAPSARVDEAMLEQPIVSESDAPRNSDVEPPIAQSTTLNSEIANYCSTAGECMLPDGYTLWRVSEDCFGEGNQWRAIYELNTTIVGGDPDLVQEGVTIRIPITDCVGTP